MIMFAAAGLLNLGAPVEVQPKVTAVSMFKNGYSAIFREATIPGPEFYVMSPTPAVYGTFWVTATNGTVIKSVVATQIESETDRNLNTLDDILTANVGKKLTLSLKKTAEAEAQVIEGTLKSASGELLIVATEAGTKAFQKARVIEVWSKTNELVYSTKTKSNKNALRIEVEPGANGKIYFMSIERGLSWAPIYNVDVTDDKTLKFSSRATVFNELVDLNKVNCSFITGFPNLKFLSALDPLTTKMSLAQFLGSIDQGDVLRDAGEMRRGQTMQNMAPAMSQLEQEFTPSTGQMEDLFFYPYPNFSLKNGDRGQFSLFKFESPYEDIYSCTLPDATSTVMAPTDPPADVWHKIRFKNNSGMPISTGTASTMKGNQTIGQDILKYIPAGDIGHLTITKALEIKVRQDAEVVKVEETSKKVGSDTLYYNKVTVKVTIKAMNLRAKESKLEVDENVRGEATTNTPNMKAVRIPSLFNAESTGSTITWSPVIPAGKSVQGEFTTTYVIPVAR